MSFKLLVVYQSRDGGVQKLVDAFASGIALAAEQGTCKIDLEIRHPLDTEASAVIAAHALVLATPEHFGSMAGATKHFFEEIWHACLEKTVGKPWQLIVKAGNDGTGAIQSVERLAKGLQWAQFRPPLQVIGDITETDTNAAIELGASLAASIELGLI